MIEPETFKQLTMLREMRNACAHSKRPLSFKNAALLNVAKRVLHGAVFKAKEDAMPQIRQAFIAECLFLFNVIISGRDEAMAMMKESYVA